MDEFTVKDSGQRLEFDSGMRRDVTDGKVLWSLIYSGPMLERWAQHLTAGAEKYGPNNWLLAEGEAELQRFQDSAARHFAQWMRGDRDEDHAAAVFFNLNGAEYVRDKIARDYAYGAAEAPDAVKYLNAGTDIVQADEAQVTHVHDPEAFLAEAIAADPDTITDEQWAAIRDEAIDRNADQFAEWLNALRGPTVDVSQTATVAAIAGWAKEEGMDPDLAREALLEMIQDGEAVIVGFDPDEGPIIATRKDLEEQGLIESCDCAPDIYRLVVTDEDSPVTGRVLNGSYSNCNDVWYAFPPGTDPRRAGLLYELTNEQVEIGERIADSLEQLLGEEE